MSANLDETNGRYNIAFLGSRADVWHRAGQEMQPGMSIDDWATAAGLDWNAVKVPAFADMNQPGINTIGDRGLVPANNHWFNVRSDTGYILGHASDRYQNVQPRGR